MHMKARAQNKQHRCATWLASHAAGVFQCIQTVCFLILLNGDVFLKQQILFNKHTMLINFHKYVSIRMYFFGNMKYVLSISIYFFKLYGCFFPIWLFFHKHTRITASTCFTDIQTLAGRLLQRAHLCTLLACVKMYFHYDILLKQNTGLDKLISTYSITKARNFTCTSGHARNGREKTKFKTD